jgi:hypothetical protein
MTQNAALLAPASIEVALDHYLVQTTGRFDRAAASLVLAEPVTRDVDLAGRTLDRLLETLAGLAIGSLAGAVIAGVRRGFGRDARARVDAAIARTIGGIAPPAVQLHALDDAPVRSLAAELQQRLRRRILFAARDARVMLVATAEAVGEPHALRRVLALLADDVVIAERFGGLVTAGWQCATAVIEGRAQEATAAVWRQWAQRISNVREQVPPTRMELAAAGFIAQIG